MPAVFEPGPDIPKGLYEQVISREIARVLNDLRARGFVSEEEQLDTADSHEVLARYVYEVLRRVLSEIPFENRIERQVAICNHVVTVLAEAGSLVNEPTSRLLAILDRGATPTGEVRHMPRPHVPLSASDLLVNARGEPAVGHALEREIPSADRIDLLCAFVRWKASGNALANGQRYGGHKALKLWPPNPSLLT